MYGEYAYLHFCSGTCAYRINVVLVSPRYIFTSSTTIWPIEGSERGFGLEFLLLCHPRKKAKGDRKIVHPSMKMLIISLDFQLHNLVTAQITMKNMYSNVWKREKQIHCCV